MRVKTLLVVIITFAVGLVAGGAGGYTLARSSLASAWLQEQAVDVEERVSLLWMLKVGEVEDAVEGLERAVDDDLIAMTVDRYVSDAALERIHAMLQQARRYRETYPRETGRDFIDRNVAIRLSGGLSDERAGGDEPVEP